MRETYSFPFGHVHWLCNSFFVMHVTHSASGREPLPPNRLQHDLSAWGGTWRGG